MTYLLVPVGFLGTDIGDIVSSTMTQFLPDSSGYACFFDCEPSHNLLAHIANLSFLKPELYLSANTSSVTIYFTFPLLQQTPISYCLLLMSFFTFRDFPVFIQAGQKLLFRSHHPSIYPPLSSPIIYRFPRKTHRQCVDRSTPRSSVLYLIHNRAIRQATWRSMPSCFSLGPKINIHRRFI